MVSLEQVEKLLQYADISYEEARDALEAVQGSLLDAIVLLERQGKIGTGGKGKRSVKTASDGSVMVLSERAQKQEKEKMPKPENKEKEEDNFFERVADWFSWGIRTMLVVYKDKTDYFTLPILVVIIVFYVALPLMLVGLFFGLRYRVDNPEKKNGEAEKAVNKVNEVFHEVGRASDAIKYEATRKVYGEDNKTPPRPAPPPAPKGTSVGQADVASEVKPPVHEVTVEGGPVQRKAPRQSDMPEMPIIDVEFQPVTDEAPAPPEAPSVTIEVPAPPEAPAVTVETPPPASPEAPKRPRPEQI